MEKLTAWGKWLFILPFTMYVLLHFGKAQTGAAFVPKWIPFPLFWDYFTGVCIVAFMISCLIGKFDKLASLLMALYVFLMILLVHIPRAATNENDRNGGPAAQYLSKHNGRWWLAALCPIRCQRYAGNRLIRIFFAFQARSFPY